MSAFLNTKGSISLLPSFRRQQLLLEFTSLKHHCPEGIYLTVHQKDPTCWSGIFFVREGPYSSAVLRFELLFPPSYPDVPPLLTVSTEIFHPLIVPLTTYSFSGAADPSATYSASDIEQLPPGSLNLRYGSPTWLSAHERESRGSRVVSGPTTMSSDGSDSERKSDSSQNDKQDSIDRLQQKSPIIKILEYLKKVFENSDMLDRLPLEMAGNPSAWHAWRSYRGLPKNQKSAGPTNETPSKSSISSRNPADWNWDGLWEARVRTGIEESISESLLFGSKNVRNLTASSDQIRFVKHDDDKLEAIQSDMLGVYGR